MDPSLFLPMSFTTPTGLPQESKLATYMNRATSTPMNITQSMSQLSLDSSPTGINKQVMIGEFVPVAYYTPGPMLPESPQSSPPAAMGVGIMPTNPPVHQENVGGTTYFYPTADSLNTSAGLSSSGPLECLGGPVVGAASPYASQLYCGTPTQMGPSTSRSGLAETFYLPETIRAEIYERNQDVFLQPDPRHYPGIELPEVVETLTDLVPLEPLSAHSLSWSFRATSRETGAAVAARRLCAQPPAAPLPPIDVWRSFDHPNIVRLHDIFYSKAFGDNSLILVYEYHPQSVTLLQKYLVAGSHAANPDASSSYVDPFSSDPNAPRPYTHQKNAMLRAVACGALLPEPVLWSVLVQLTAALRSMHNAGLACRSLDPTKVIVSGCRVRIAWCGIADAIQNNVVDIAQAQQEDLAALGRLALALACRAPHCDNLSASMDLVSRTYSTDLKNFIVYLLSTSPAQRSVIDLMPIIGARFYNQVEALECRADACEAQLAREIDNGRLLRILVKLGLVNERPELNMDPSWSETGDRYMLKLFRDYMFHSVTEEGRPWVDQAHLAHCLNHLDGGSPAKVGLMSRDEQSVLVVSYAELKHCLEAAFEEVMLAAGAPE